MSTVTAARCLWGLVPLAYVGLQWFTAAAWPVPYDVWNHTISDLGWTTCTTERRPSGMMQSCSPRHAWFNLGGIVLWVLAAVGATAISGTLPAGRLPRAIVVVWWVVAIFGIGVCLVPGDVDLVLHSLLAIPTFLGVGAVLVLSGIAWRRRSPVVAIGALIAAAGSVVGLVGLVVALTGYGPVGLFERLAAETVYPWMFLMAIVGPGGGVARPGRAGADSSDDDGRAVTEARPAGRRPRPS